MDEKRFQAEARRYLLSFPCVTEAMIDRQLGEWRERKPRSVSALFRAFLMHAQNRQGMPNAIGNIDNLASVLFGFNPSAVLKAYAAWDEIFDAIQHGLYKPPGRMQKENAKNYWVIYCKAIQSIALFLSTFETIEAFDQFVEGFLTNEYSRLALPLLLEKEIFGFGFALACDCLKENGYPQFLKPDTHIKDIALGLGITTSASDYQVFKDLQAYCQRNEQLPYEVDKLFWLVGSGSFYLSGIKVKSSKWDYISNVKDQM